MKRLVIFDCDGTLVDTIGDVLDCFNQALVQNGFPARGMEWMRRAVGGNLEQVVSRLLPEDARSEANVNRVKADYRALYAASEKPRTQPYPGMRALVKALRARGVHLTINSNKAQSLTEALIAKLFPDGEFESIAGYDERYPAKPDPDGCHRILRQFGLERTDAVYVGDGHSDLETAFNAGIDCLMVPWGQGTEEDLSDPRGILVRTPEEILEFVGKEIHS